MKKIILFLSSVIFAFSLNLHQRDKQKHVIATSLISFSSGVLYSHYYPNSSKIKKFFVAFSIGVGVGILKELRDERQKNDYFDHKDLQADILGSLLGSIATIEIKW